MFAILLAVLAAASWGFSAVLVRMGLRDVSTASGTLLSLAAGLVMTAVLAVTFEWSRLTGISLTAVLLFGVIGILNFPMGRYFNYMSMSHLGVGRSTPILASAPLFAIVVAVALTGEQLRVATAAGVVCILCGLYVTITAPRAEGATTVVAGGRRQTLIGIAFGLGAALAYGSSQVLTRHTVSALAPPLVGAALALAWGTAGFSVFSLGSLRQRSEHFWRGARFFMLAGLFSATGVLLMFSALRRGEVVVLSPVLATNPLFTLVFAALLLRGVERITSRVVIGALLVVGGVVVLSVA